MIVNQSKRKITFPADIIPVMYGILAADHEIDQSKEHFWVVGLNGSHVIQYIELVSLGLVNRTLVHPREVFRFAIMKAASAVILVHNHPSGNTIPSPDDEMVTQQLKAAGNIIGIGVLDHIIIGRTPEDKAASFLELGLL